MTTDSTRESAPVVGVLYCPTCELEAHADAGVAEPDAPF